MMEFQRWLFCVALLFVSICSSEAASRRECRRDSLTTLQGQIRTLEEAQEVIRGDLVALQEGVHAIESLVGAAMPEDCYAAKVRGSRRRIVTIKPPGLAPREVVCEQVREGGGWTVMLARFPTTDNHTARQDFNRTWKEYRQGFGDLHGEFWIGNEVLHALTSQAPHQLYVFLEDWNNQSAEGMWNTFNVAGETEGYKLSVEAYQSMSTTGDSLDHHNHRHFSTYDRDSDGDDEEHCAKSYGGGWWYHRCHKAHLTGAPVTPGQGGAHAITWRTWRHTTGLKSAFVAFRPMPPMMPKFKTHP